MTRSHAPGTLERLRAVLTSTGLYQVAAHLDGERPVGRPPVNPGYVLLAYGILARLTRSGTRVEVDLAEPHTWAYARTLMTQAEQRRALGLPEPAERPPTWDHWRWYRNHHLATDDALGVLASVFPAQATALARQVGLLDPHGPGSPTHPHPTRAVYGDGTTVRPMYRPPETVMIDLPDGGQARRYLEPGTGQLLDDPPGRHDPDLREWHGAANWQQGHSYVAFHTRGPAPYQRVVLAVDHIPAPGAEANTAVDLLRDVHRHAKDGIQVVVYDGAFTGAHIDTIMTRYGYLTIAKMPTGEAAEQMTPPELVRTRDGRRARSYPLGTVTHTTPAGPCEHVLATVGGHVTLIDLDERGDPVAVGAATRGPVKRSRRATGAFHFNVGYTIPCTLEPFTVWLSPHAGPDGDTRRPHNLRVISETDPDFYTLRGLRSDAENYHANLKRTLLVDRAMSLGWRRGLVENYCFCLLNNALTEHRATQAVAAPTTLARVLHP
ncbi:MAG TPA: hypothetical protein VFX60_13285 [Micromonospora sp.]|nr:hypothetical protein [Micromonospora sp.]